MGGEGDGKHQSPASCGPMPYTWELEPTRARVGPTRRRDRCRLAANPVELTADFPLAGRRT